ncbi:DUF6276 family protein [Natrialbaceae archaeon AArc-T1-2]|uniref:DUF6276 family protein n=1 Tax=Natrialbaceae archaeon AArc-T1-2 TaxID=3053904 RepID=UPI00255A771A|nr:DUF6276 family protein [Natrialbaceae archaeon AArc-T1-2]WIV68659.1 DUF6276 family protein [Natrialbaceae archaeon AArc-T1-2]
MACTCERDPVAFSIPAPWHEHAPENAAVAAICPRCLAVYPAEDAATSDGSDPDPDPDFSRVSETFPTGDGAVALALTLGLCDSLATNRASLEATLEAAERAGVDPLLAIDRLCADPSIEPAIDLERRREQLESLLY